MRKAILIVLLAMPALAGEYKLVREEFFDVGPCIADADAWSLPHCSDYDLDTALIDAMDHDPSAAALLQQRYPHLDNYSERWRVAAALVGHVKNDSLYWNDLSAHAEQAFRFTDENDHDAQRELAALSEQHGVSASTYQYMLLEAFVTAAMIPRSKPLLLRALKSDGGALARFAIDGLAGQHDVALLPQIAEALERLKETAPGLASELQYFECAEADAVALRFLTDPREIEQYKQDRLRPLN